MSLRRHPLTRILPALLLLLAPSLLEAGTYSHVVSRVGLDPSRPDVEPEDILPPFAIMHPRGYNGSGAPLTIRVCVEPGDDDLIAPTQSAIQTWSALLPALANCQGCVLAEEPAPAAGDLDRTSTILHELGHCALGLGHINLIEGPSSGAQPWLGRVGSCDVSQNDVCGEPTSFTASVNSSRVLSAVGTPRGDSEDQHQNNCPTNASATPDPTLDPRKQSEDCADERGLGCPGFPACCPACPGPQCPATPWQIGDISWFRIADNNPFAIDATVIDMLSFSRNDLNLPSQDDYIASANRAVGEALGHPGSQSVMYSEAARGLVYSGLTADDVNMVKMAMTGADRTAGTTDDYTVQLQYVASCATADVLVRFGTEYVGGGLGVCASTIQDSFPQPDVSRIHHTLIPFPDELYLIVELNRSFPWPLFSSTFETGDLSEWSAAEPISH